MTKQRTRTKPARTPAKAARRRPSLDKAEAVDTADWEGDKQRRLTQRPEKNVDQPCPTKEVLRSIQYLPEASLTIEQVLEGVRSLMSRCRASEEILYEELLSEADGWKMRLEEVQNDDGIEDEDEDDNG